MKIKQLVITSLFTATALVTGCKKNDSKSEAKSADTAAPTGTAGKPTEAAKPADPAPAKAEPVEMVEHDLSVFGDAFKGYVVLAPKTAKLEFDDPSRHITLSDTDYVAIGEAPYWEDAVKSLSSDKDNKNIRKVSDTEVRYERTPPLGTAYAVDILVSVGGTKWSCTAGDPGTFSGAAMADQIATICKSIKKK
jgi:hypothetical protein